MKQQRCEAGRVVALTLVYACTTATVVASGCGRSAVSVYRERLATSPAPVEHAVHDERLRQLMRRIERFSPERLSPAVDTDEERMRRVADIVEVSRAMAQSAPAIVATSASLDLTPDEHESFEALAGQLRQQSLALANAAPTAPNGELQQRLEEIDHTCQACHQQFRATR